MTEQPLVELALKARTKADEDAASKAAKDAAARAQVGIRLVREKLGIETTVDQWTAVSREAQIILDGVVIHTSRNPYGGGDILRTGEHEIRSLSHLGTLILNKHAKLNEVPCPTCHGSGTVVEGAVTTC